MKAIQDYYAPEMSHCFGCGTRNAQGYRLKSHFHGSHAEALFTIDRQYSGGFPDYAYGGIVASLLDCHGIAAAAAFFHQAQGKTLEGGEPLPRFVTGSLKVDYKRPTPLGVELRLRGSLRSIEGRRVTVELALLDGAEVCATGELLAVQLKG
ncbi:thioesterase [Solimonas fluminis]|uniref:Thioesterase n=1 Tax=Solimonas fluminis TaxID=2086571 RepID=A0A2S5TAR4_9GAMM|nr:hotdog domain-containing protein [Solimonas fluminis]PPE72065.1 thioesterase [Solimonas fluminis]